MFSLRREDAKGRRGILKAKAVVGQGAESSGFRRSEPCSRDLGGDRPIACRAGSYEGLGVAGCHETTKRRNDQSDQPYGQGEKAIEFDLLLVVQFADFGADFLGTYGDDPVCLNLGRFFKPVRDLGFDGKAQ